MKINVFDILNSPNASLHDDGILVYNTIIQEISNNKNQPIEVDFSNIKRCSTLFLNASFGKLLADLGTDTVKKCIHPEGYSQILNFSHKYNEMWDNFVNKDNYQAYRNEAFA